MGETEEKYGSLLFFRKNGKPGTSYSLGSGKICIGHSTDADIRLKLKDEHLLEEIHCIIDVTDNGIATIVNKSSTAPVTVNSKPVTTSKVLCNRDQIYLVGKKFEYLNDTLSAQEVEKHQTALNKMLKASPRKRRSVAPVIKIQDTPNFRTKTPAQKRSLLRKSLNRNNTPALTPSSKFISHTLEKPKTTSKLVVSKALGSPIKAKGRRLSWNDNLSKICEKPKVSERNILLPGTITHNSSLGKLALSPFSHEGNDLEVQTEKKSVKETPLSAKTPNKLKHKTPVKTPKSATLLSKIVGKSNLTKNELRTPKDTPKKLAKTPKNTPKKLAKGTSTPSILLVSTPVHTKFNISENKTSASKKTPKKVAERVLTPIKTPKSTSRNKNTPESSITLSTPAKTGTPKIKPLSSKGNLSNNKPKNKRLELLKGTPTSTKKSSPAKNSASPSSNIILDMEGTPKSSFVKKDGDLSSASKTDIPKKLMESPTPQISIKRTKSVENMVSLFASRSKRRKTEGHQPNDAFKPSKTGRKSQLTSVDSGDFSEGSVALNLSIGSSISPIQPRKTLASTDSDIFDPQIPNDPRHSLGKVSPRKSVRKSRQKVTDSEDKDEASESPKSSHPEPNSLSRLSVPGNKEVGMELGESTDGSESFHLELTDSFSKSKSRSLRPSENTKSVNRNSVKGNGERTTAEENSSDSLDTSIEEDWNNGYDQDMSDSLEYSSFEERYDNMKSNLEFGSLHHRSSTRSRQSTKNSVKNTRTNEIQSSSEDSDVANLLKRRSKVKDNQSLKMDDLQIQEMNTSTSAKKRQSGRASTNRAREGYNETSPLAEEVQSSSEESEAANLLKHRNRAKGNQSLTMDDSQIQEMNTSTSVRRQSARASMNKEREQSNETSPLASRRSSRRNEEPSMEVELSNAQYQDTPSKDESNISHPKSIFVPQRRPSLKRSYLGSDRDLLIRISRSTPPSDENLTGEEAHEVHSVSLRRSSRSKSISNCKSCGTSPAKTHVPTEEDSDTSIFNQSISSENLSSTESELEEYNSNSKRMSETQPDLAESGSELSDISSKSSRTSRSRVSARYSNKTPISMSRPNDTVITVDDDSVKGTPENNTSIIILDTPFEKSRRVSHAKPSKTLNSSFEDDAELTTPKSAIKSRRSKSLPYQPIVEDVTPVTLQEVGEEEEVGFKTPMNTPGLFENIKKSVLKSRSRRRSSNNLMEELNKAEAKRTAKRPRESSTGSVDRSTKKRKVLGDITLESLDEDLDASFSSFASDEVFPDMLDQSITPNTPEGFKNLTDKPLITDPQSKSLTEPRKRKVGRNRLSLHAMRLDSQFSDDDKMTDIITSSDSTGSFSESNSIINESMESRRISRRLSLKAQKSPMSDVTNVRSPKNDLTDVQGVKRLMRTPKPVSSPKNDLRNIIGVKKLLSTPKLLNSPKNDLTLVPNLRKLIYPVQENSPKNDLSDVAGIKKLLGTPREVKSPKNDLRKVPNLRKLMSPKQQNSPRNDLSDVAGLKKLLSTPGKQKEPKNDLTNVAGVKKLLSTPTKQKSPKNDLTKVPNLRNLMSPKRQNSPSNDLSDVEGVAEIFNVSRVDSTDNSMESNESLFERLFDKKPIRTYRGRSLSPITRKAMIFGDDQRKTLGDTPVSSPRVKKWLEDQAVIRLERVDTEESAEDKHTTQSKTYDKKNNKKVETFASPKTVRSRQKKGVEQTKIPSPTVNVDIDSVSEFASPKTVRSRQKKGVEQTKIPSPTVNVEIDSVSGFASPKTIRGRQKKEIEQTKIPSSTVNAEIDDSVEEFKSPLPAKRGRLRKASVKEDPMDQISEINSTTEDIAAAPVAARTGRRRNASASDEIESSDNEVTPVIRTRGKSKKVVRDGKSNSTERKPAKRGRKPSVKDESTDTEVEALPKKPARRGRKPSTQDDSKSEEVKVEELPRRRGRPRAASRDGSIDSTTKKYNTRRKLQEEEEEEETLLPTETFKKAQHRKRSMSCSELMDLMKRPTRGRKVQKKDEEKSDDSGIRTLPKRKGKIRSASVEATSTENAKDEVMDVKTTTEPKDQGIIAEVVKPIATEQKRGRGKKTAKQNAIEDDTEIKNEAKKGSRRKIATVVLEQMEEPPNKNSRSKKVIEESVESSKVQDDNETKKLTEIGKKAPVRRGNRKKPVEFTEVEEPIKEVVPEKKSEPKKKPPKSTSSPQELPKKRGGRRKNEVKEAEVLTNENDKENLEEEIPQKKTKTRRAPAIEKIEENAEDSPRTTRQRKGNLRKYATESSSEAQSEQTQKKVRFENNEEQDNGKKKRGGKVVEEIEETIRRSKRTRK